MAAKTIPASWPDDARPAHTIEVYTRGNVSHDATQRAIAVAVLGHGRLHTHAAYAFNAFAAPVADDSPEAAIVVQVIPND